MSAPITGYTELDLIGFTDKGPFNPNATYFKNDLVLHNGIKWRVLTDNLTGVTPSEGANYTLYMKAVESFKGRSGSVLPMAGDYDAPKIILASAMHIGGETQTNVEDALQAIVDNPSGHNILNSSAIPMAGFPNLQFGGQYDKFKVVDDESDPLKKRNIVHAQLWICESQSDWETMTDAQFLAKYGANRDDEDVYWYRPWASETAYASDRTPVGTVLSLSGDVSTIPDYNSRPTYPNDDYLICKGTNQKIGDFPQLYQFFQTNYGDGNYFGSVSTPAGYFTLPNWTADFPENGVLVIKARTSSTTITEAEVDETGLSSRTDEVPNCARVAALEGKTYHRSGQSVAETVNVTLTNSYQQLIVSSHAGTSSQNLYMVSHVKSSPLVVNTIVNVGTGSALTFTRTGDYELTIAKPQSAQLNIMSAEKFTAVYS